MGHHYQESDVSCGAAALHMALSRVGIDPPPEAALMDELDVTLHGTHVQALEAAVARRGLGYKAWRGAGLRDLAALLEDHVVIVCYQSPALRTGHFAVVESMGDHVALADPWFGPDTNMDAATFLDVWRAEPHGAAPLPRWLLAIER